MRPALTKHSRKVCSALKALTEGLPTLHSCRCRSQRAQRIFNDNESPFCIASVIVFQCGGGRSVVRNRRVQCYGSLWGDSALVLCGIGALPGAA